MGRVPQGVFLISEQQQVLALEADTNRSRCAACAATTQDPATKRNRKNSEYVN
jgi:hypothetical protein